MPRTCKKFTRRFEVEALEDRCTPSVASALPDVDLSARGAIGEINGAIFRQTDAQPTGTGYINSFVRLQAQGAKATMQQGYNTDHRPLQFDENSSPQFTRSLSLGDVPVVDIGGVKYREFLLDINQKASQPYLSLDQLRLYTGGAGNLSGYNTATHQLAGLDPVYDLDANGDHWVKLDARLNQGSGKGDMLLYIPDSAFANAGPGAFVYLYSKFGENFTPNAGFEEWAVSNSALTSAQGVIAGTVRDTNGNPMVDVTIFIDANHNGVLDNNEIYTTTDASGVFAFSNLATGLGDYSVYDIQEVPPTNYTELGSAWQVSLNTAGEIFSGVNFVNKAGSPIVPPS